jgi:hypothetical protein
MRALMFVVAVAAASAGCTLEDTGSYNGAEFHSVIQNRLSSNRLSSNRLSSNRLSSNRLSSNALDSTKLVALQETAQILSDDEGRDVYSYIISCALPAPMTIVADLNYLPLAQRPADTTCADPGAGEVNCPNYDCAAGVCTFYGNLGLTPGWIDKKLDHAGKAWISACLFARVNANNVAEAVSMRGRNEGLVVGVAEREQFTLEEGAFYGNLFVNNTDPMVPPDWNACRGADKAADPTDGGLANRRCAEENPTTPGFTYCGFKYNGDCGDFEDAATAPACRTYDAANGAYNDCKGVNGHRQNAKYRTVITVHAVP